jgi:2,3-bisphosphoglycerate-independent phosphoglycerate mutase
MIDHHTHQAHTAHTLNPVPFLYVGRKATVSDKGSLRDIAPSLLDMMGLPSPVEMTGKSLIHLQ